MEEMKKKLVSILGQENVSDNSELLDSYAEDKSFIRLQKPWYIVKPRNAEQVQEIVKWANETKTPLVPVSSGTPHYKGDTVPSVPQAVIVDLSEMKKILSINRQHRMAIVEPGVTYGELQAELAKKGMTLSTSLAPRATKSVLTSVLEVEPRLNPFHQWNYTDPLRCTEVTWGDGVRMYTGEAGGSPMDLQKQWEKEKWQISSNGPMMLDFYRLLTAAQGSMGIVNWVSLKCDILPKIHKLFFVPAKKQEELHDFVYRVVRLRFGDELFILNGSYLAYLLEESVEQIGKLQEELPSWVALVGIAGREMLPEERVEAQEHDIAEIAKQHSLRMVSEISGFRGEEVLEKAIKPSNVNYWKETYKGGFQEIFFVTSLEKTTRFIEKMYSLAQEAGYPIRDIGIYIQPQHLGSSYHLEFNLPYRIENSEEVVRMKKLFTAASEEFSSMGAYFARPYGIWARLQLNKDTQSYITLKKIKGIFDPNNIMNTGKLTI